MNNRSLLLAAMIISVAFYLTACKKKKNNNPFGDQRIALIDYSHAGGILHYRVVYDNYYNVDSIVYIGDGYLAGTSGLSAFNYFGSSYSITDAAGATFTVYANTAGQILEVLQTDTLFMKYNGSQLGSIDDKVATATYPFYKITTTSYSWTNGDVASSVTNGITTTYDYDLSRSGQPGDPQRIYSFLRFGRPLVKSVHLLKDVMSNGAAIKQYFYQFEGSGRIKQLMEVDNIGGLPPVSDTFVYDYTYY